MSETRNDESCMCNICLEGIKTDQAMIRTKCGHKFHQKCLKKWKRSHHTMSNTCPVCRTVISKKRKRDDDIEFILGLGAVSLVTIVLS